MVVLGQRPEPVLPPAPHPTHPPTCLLQTISLPPGEAWEEVERQLGANIATQAIALFFADPKFGPKLPK